MVEYASCQATRADGTPCAGRARTSGYCFAHDVELEAVRAQGAARGGHNKSKVVRVQRALDGELSRISEQLLRALSEVHGGDITPAQGQAMSAVAGAYLKVLEVAELSARVEEIEARLLGEER